MAMRSASAIKPYLGAYLYRQAWPDWTMARLMLRNPLCRLGFSTESIPRATLLKGSAMLKRTKFVVPSWIAYNAAMRRRRVRALCFAVLLALSPLLGTGGGADIELLVPLYSYPAWYDPTNYIWSSVAAAAGQVPVTAVINPNNGPDGGPPNADYLAGLNDLRSADVTILGYVYTTYGARSLAAVQSDIDLYDQHFNIDGIFVDEVSTSTNQLGYY